jgi:putative NADH-flavin reductase
MKVALFGATGGTGRQVLAQALEQGHQVTALVRDPAKLGERGSDVNVVQGDVLDQERVDACIGGADAVICVLGSHKNRDPIEARGTVPILDAMQRLGVRRLIAVTSLGVGDSTDQLPAPFRLFMKLTIGGIMQAKEEQERLIRASGLDWTIVRPGGLTDGAKTGNYQSGTDKAIRAGRISRADVADFVLRQLDDDRFLHQTPAVS